mmetsp:Transcript_30602/g.98536  ORF Transcript_30602/g.98536 Transcript_30602/m.98536 type:complete len:201 (-) Transcript_30602:13-615(-)
MDIESIQPFHLLLHTVKSPDPQILVGDGPCKSRQQSSNEQEVEANSPKDQPYEGSRVCDSERNGVCDSSNQQEEYTQDRETRVIPCPLVLRLLMEARVLIDALRVDTQRDHLPRRVLKVHLRVFYGSPEIIRNESASMTIESRGWEHFCRFSGQKAEWIPAAGGEGWGKGNSPTHSGACRTVPHCQRMILRLSPAPFHRT